MPIHLRRIRQDSSKPKIEIQPAKNKMDGAINVLRSNADEWANMPASKRLALLETIIHNWTPLLEDMVLLANKAKSIETGDFSGEEWLLGPYILMKNLQALRHSLIDIVKHGKPIIPGPVTITESGQTAARVFPQTIYDKLLYRGHTIDVWMKPGITKQQMLDSQARSYTDEIHDTAVEMVLGSGNLSSMGPMDIVNKLFVEGHVVLYKTHPVSEYTTPLLEKGFKELIRQGFLRIVSGGIEESAYLCNHGGIDSIHMVGSNETFESIVFGSGQEGQLREKNKEPINKKPVSCELGNVTPYIIIPGPWSEKDLAYHADHLASTVTNNASCNCITPRVIIQHKGWSKRHAFLDSIRDLFSKVPSRVAYYPGAQTRHAFFVFKHPEAELYGKPSTDELPWTLIPDIDHRNENDICFTTESFCSIVAETGLEASDVIDYMEKAVAFCNKRLWGNLAATIIVHPDTLKDKAVAKAFEKMISNLRYGTVAINQIPSLAFSTGLSPWGGFPGNDISDIQSGNGISNNALMLADTQKTIVRAPFIVKPTPSWFVTQNKKTASLFKKLTYLEASPKLSKLPGILLTAFKKTSFP